MTPGVQEKRETKQREGVDGEKLKGLNFLSFRPRQPNKSEHVWHRIHAKFIHSFFHWREFYTKYIHKCLKVLLHNQRETSGSLPNDVFLTAVRRPWRESALIKEIETEVERRTRSQER